MPVTSEKYKLSFGNVNLYFFLIEEKLLHPSYVVQVIVIHCFATLPALKTTKKSSIANVFSNPWALANFPATKS